jgi:extradiol dioxygenase family protein
MAFHPWHRTVTVNPEIVNILQHFQWKKFAERTQARCLMFIKEQNPKITFFGEAFESALYF